MLGNLTPRGMALFISLARWPLTSHSRQALRWRDDEVLLMAYSPTSSGSLARDVAVHSCSRHLGVSMALSIKCSRPRSSLSG